LKCFYKKQRNEIIMTKLFDELIKPKLSKKERTKTKSKSKLT